MTRGGVKEYIEAIRGGYTKANRKVKGRILDEVAEVTGYHRKPAIRLLSRGPKGILAGVAAKSNTEGKW